MPIVQTLQIVLANVFLHSFKAQSYHWNVRGMFFAPLHTLFQELYEDGFKSVDDLAEHIRICGELAPRSIADLYKVATVEEDVIIPGTPEEMIRNLITSNEKVISSMRSLCNDMKDIDGYEGLEDYIQNRIGVHEKFQWILRSHISY